MKSFIVVMILLFSCSFLYAENLEIPSKSFPDTIIGDKTFVGDISTDYNINLITTTSATTGIITKSGSNFIHDFNDPTTAGQNVFIGKSAGNISLAGGAAHQASNNVGIGAETLFSLTSGFRNMALGYQALYSVTSGDSNLGLGYTAGKFITTGDDNVLVGKEAGLLTAASGGNTTIENCIYIGAEVRSSADAVTNEIAIGHSAIGKGNNSATLGADSITATYLKGATSIRGANNSCIITVDDNGTCDAGTEIAQDNSIAICLVCAAN